MRAQQPVYAQALAEIRAGRKQSHWMWFVFPQFAGLGHSPTSLFYSIKSLDEAAAYLAHPVLGPRLLECFRAVVSLQTTSAVEVFGTPDDMKLRSSATLFAQVSPGGSVFERTLDRFFHGEPDAMTLRHLSRLQTGGR